MWARSLAFNGILLREGICSLGIGGFCTPLGKHVITPRLLPPIRYNPDMTTKVPSCQSPGKLTRFRYNRIDKFLYFKCFYRTSLSVDCLHVVGTSLKRQFTWSYLFSGGKYLSKGQKNYMVLEEALIPKKSAVWTSGRAAQGHGCH